MEDPYNLARFLAAQEPLYRRVCAELATCEKRTHWMWFNFPQLRGLAFSAAARTYGISSLAEARAYLAHPVLGERLIECTQLTNRCSGRCIEDIFPYPDHLKFHSSMTLFAVAADASTSPFRDALEQYFAGAQDEATLRLLSQGPADKGA